MPQEEEMQKKRCNRAFYAKVVVTNDANDGLHLTMFENSIKRLVNIYKAINPNSPLVYNQLSDDDVMEIMLEMEQLHITYDGAKVVNIQV